MDLIELGYIGLFLGTLLAATIIPFSSEIILSALLFSGFDPFLCFVYATLGNSVGSIITYFMGRLVNYEKALNKLKINPKRVQKSAKFFNKYGPGIAFFAWLPIIGDAFAFLLGSNKTAILPTFVLFTLGKALRFAVVIWVYNTSISLNYH